MPTTFDEVLLDIFYTSEAVGGPEAFSAIIRSGQGGGMAFRNQNLEDYISRFEIDYSVLTVARRKALRSFAILREGMTRGFRFLAPDDNWLIGDDELGENLGYLNNETGEVERLSQTDGELTTFYLIKHYSDQANFYTRRIVKPSPFEDVTITLYELDGTTEVGSDTIPAESALGAFSVINATVESSIATPGLINYTFNFHTGTIVFDNPLPEDLIPKIICQYHLPVVMGEDWHKSSIDDGSLAKLQVRLNEILPVELGIT